MVEDGPALSNVQYPQGAQHCKPLKTWPPGLSLEGAEHLQVSLRHRSRGAQHSQAVAFSCQSGWKSLPKLNMQQAVPGGGICVPRWCVWRACSCQQADRSANDSGQCTLSVELLVALWEGNASCSFLKCTNLRKNGFEMETLERICWHTDGRSLLLLSLVKLHNIRAMFSLFSFTFVFRNAYRSRVKKFWIQKL